MAVFLVDDTLFFKNKDKKKNEIFCTLVDGN
jgi:chromosomal replication initiation ATPase DnaA